ncbi:hypothetical protein HPB52_015803 [Rhipicephalus sanguineus]|uniref:RING-type domain-containing protein n=1 Tax=Rhipicephalus sanguineus TaxID=34632 RepID=A0A9D4T6B4_RHISA|nr:hypothetical protein HPB52_015803 [Rhipicephalus sanguineus]
MNAYFVTHVRRKAARKNGRAQDHRSARTTAGKNSHSALVCERSSHACIRTTMPDLRRVHRFRDHAVAGVNWRPTRFVDEVPNLRVCGLCRMIPRRILVLPCGHLLCQSCHTASSQGCRGQCPLDQEPFEEDECDSYDFPTRKANALKTLTGPHQRSDRPSPHTALPREGWAPTPDKPAMTELIVQGEDLPLEEFNKEYGWKTASSKRSSAVAGRVNRHVSTSSQAGHCISETPSIKTGGNKLKNGIVRASRMPPMPKEHIRIVIIPRGALNITKTGPTIIGRAVVEVASLNPS